MNELTTTSRNQKQIEHEAFYGGTQGCDPTHALAEMDSRFNQQKEMVAHKATPRIKELEGTIEDTTRRYPAAKERLESIVARHGGRLPEIVMPVFITAIGLFAVVSESAMLAPFMDLFDVTNPIWQHLAAFALGCVCAVILHAGIESLTPGRFELNMQRLLRVLSVFCLFGLAWAGVTRGKQAAYGATLSGSPLGKFLGDNPILTIIVYAFFTLAFPVTGAVAISLGMKAAREWREFLLAKRDVVHLTTVAAKAPKELEGEHKKLAHELEAIDQTRKEWQKAYLVQHDRGTALGAAQTPKWMVWLKATLAGLIGLLVSLPFMSIPLVPIIVPMAAFVAAWIYFRHAWAHPKPSRIYNQQNVAFRNTGNSGGAK